MFYQGSSDLQKWAPSKNIVHVKLQSYLSFPASTSISPKFQSLFKYGAYRDFKDKYLKLTN